MSVRSEGSAVAGSTDYSLVCDISIPSLSDTPPSVTWTLPSHTTQTGSAVASGGQSYVSRLPLTPLTHDDEGDYTCTAEYTENGEAHSASDTYHVSFGKKIICKTSFVTREEYLITKYSSQKSITGIGAGFFNYSICIRVMIITVMLT